MKDTTIHLGYEVGTGEPVSVPLRNIAVTGQTQESGKTTTLEALAARSGVTVLTFVTKRGEGSFGAGRRVQPYFRERADWQFVDSLLEAALSEKNKFLRQFLIPICRTTKTLKQVQTAVRDGMKKASGIKAGAFVQLDAYLDLIVPEIERAKLASTLDIKPGLNVMDVSDFRLPMQMLFVQSALDWINEHAHDTVVVMPEAWEFIPQNKGSPVKESAIALVRKGSGIGNRIWVDSQDMAGVDNTILRGCPVWLVGVQREINEIKRNIANIPPPAGKPKPADVAMLERGQFFVCFGSTLVKVYVQPTWMPDDEAIAIAKGMPVAHPTAPPRRVAPTRAAPPLAPTAPIEDPKEDEVDQATADALIAENVSLKDDKLKAHALGYQAGLIDGEDKARKAFDAFRGMAASKVRTLAEEIGAAVMGYTMPAGGAHIDRRPPAKPAPAAPPLPVEQKVARPARAVSPGGPDFSMLGPLVRSHPQPLTAELWGLFLGLSAGTTKSGPWHRKVRALADNGYIEKTVDGFTATATGIAASSEDPSNPQNAEQLWAVWRKQICDLVGSGAITLLRILALHRSYRLTNEQLALLAGKAPGTAKSGPWFSLLKSLREWDLIEGDRSYAITLKGRAIIQEGGEPATTSTAEDIRLARYARLEGSKRHYDALTEPMTKKELGESLGMSEGTMKSGPWHGAVKTLVESGLVEDRGGTLMRRAEELMPVA